MLVSRRSSELSGHQNLKEIKKVTTSERSRGICSSTPPATDLLAAPASRGSRSFDRPDHRFRLLYRLLILFLRHRIGDDGAACLNVALLSFEEHAADGNARV